MILGLDRYEIDKMVKETRTYCQHCICKTRAIAEINGGAPGCGDCYECITSGKYIHFCNGCKEYYNPNENKNLNLTYLIGHKEEENENDN